MKCKVIKNYKSAYSDPIRLMQGDVVDWSERESQWKGWVWCKEQNGKKGWIPESILAKEGSKATIIKDYSAIELTIEEGETLEILCEESGWLWCKNNKGDCGWVPKEKVI